jgi:hypothetical protein
VECIYRYADGREERDPPFETHEHYGIGEVREHDGIRWSAVDSRTFVRGDPNRVELFFVPEIIAAIRNELFRLRARPEDVGAVDGISVQDRGHENAALTGSVKQADFNYFGAGTEILERLRGLPDDGGPEAIRSEFGRGH